MDPDQRRAAILDLAQRAGELTVEELAHRFDISRETVRRDLAYLDSAGLLRRVHGGAQKPKLSSEAPFSQRLTENAAAKERIARAAAGLFQDGETVMIDAGTTTEFFAAALCVAARCTVVTNSIGVALKVQEGGSRSKVYLLGGECRADTKETVGSVTLEQVARFRADHAVLTIGAIDAELGLMDFDVEEAMVARAMISQARKLTIIADHSKFDRVGMAWVCDFGAVDRIVTDRLPSDPVRAAIAEHGTVLLVADGTGGNNSVD
jgi:DeoR family glycerol-3-phosphate regulon repressor